jgi:Ring finger domain
LNCLNKEIIYSTDHLLTLERRSPLPTMDFFFVYLLCTVAVLFSLFLVVSVIVWLADCCKTHIDSVRYQWRWESRRNLMPNIHLPTRWSLWPRRNRSRTSISLATQSRSLVISSVHRMPCGACQSNAMSNAPLATNQSQRITHLPSRPHQSNADVTVPLATQQSSITLPMPCGCRAHQSNILAVPLPTPQPQTMTPMRYVPNSTNATTDAPVTILQSQVMAHIVHGPHRSQTMTPMRYGSQTNARAHTPHGSHHRNSQAACQLQRMVLEHREGPNRRNSDLGAHISASMYQKYENDKNTECAVCLGALNGGEMVMRMPICSHVYHERCICQWLLQEPSCPLCRSPVRAQLSVRVGDN